MTPSVLEPGGAAARAIAEIGWVLIAGGAVVFCIVMGLLALALRGSKRTKVRPLLWLVGGGIAFPAVVLAALFAYSVSSMPAWQARPPGALLVSVTGRMWWWEVRYVDPASRREIVLANEIRIPVGKPASLSLGSDGVIHSLWVPELAGKMDMVPGRVNHLVLQAERPGMFRGQCAEFCGEQHALMALHVVAQPQAEFDAWLAAQAREAAAPSTAEQERGREAFLAQRCNACHTVRGVAEEGRLGPDLTHVGSRLHLAAGTLRNDAAAMQRWIAHTQQVKPGARMPSSAALDARTLADLSAWLESLR